MNKLKGSTFNNNRWALMAGMLYAIFGFSTNTWAQTSTTADIENPVVASLIEDTRSENPKLAAELTDIYHSTKKYQDVKVAEAEGYMRDPMNLCDTAPMMGEPSFLGAMGIHFFRPDLVGVTATEPRINGNGLHTDFSKPAILIYEPQADGSLELVAIENLVFQEGWHAAGNENKPRFMDYEYFPMADNKDTEVDEAHMFEPHYDLHMWLYRPNPHGLFMPFNPAVSCSDHKG